MSQHVLKNADNVKRKGPAYFFTLDRILHLHVVYYIPGGICNDCVCCVHVLYLRTISCTHVCRSNNIICRSFFVFVKCICFAMNKTEN